MKELGRLGYGFVEAMEVIPFAAGLQLIDADYIANGIELVYVSDDPEADFDSQSLIDKAFLKFHGKTSIH